MRTVAGKVSGRISCAVANVRVCLQHAASARNGHARRYVKAQAARTNRWPVWCCVSIHYVHIGSGWLTLLSEVLNGTRARRVAWL